MSSTTQRRVDELRRRLRELEVAPVAGAQVAAFRSLFDELVCAIEGAKETSGNGHVAVDSDLATVENAWLDAERTVHFGRFIVFGDPGGGGFDQSPLWVSEEIGRIAGGVSTSDLATLRAFVERVVHPDERRRFTELVTEALRQPASFDLRFRLARPDGSLRWARIHGASIRSGGEGRIRIQAIVIDSTELETGFRARATLDAVFDSTVDAIVVTAPDGRILRWNPAAESFFPSLRGGRANRSLGELGLEAMGARDDRRLEDVAAAAAGGRLVEHSRWRVTHDDGAELVASLSISPVRDRDGTITAVTIVARDETAQHWAHRELRARDRRWLELVRAAPDAIIFLDAQDKIVSFNPAAQGMFGYAEREIVGRDVGVLEADDEHAWTARAEFVPGTARETSARYRDGRPFPVEVSVCDLRSDDPVRKAVFLRDISVRRRLERELVDKERLAAVGMAASMFAHEVGNPLNNMYLHMQMLERQVEDAGMGSRLGARVEGVMAEVCRLNALLEEFRSWHRRERVQLRPTDLRRVLGEVFRFHEADAPRHGVELECELPRVLPPVQGNADKLKQVFHNLVKNSCEAMSEGGRIRISASVAGETISVDFRDSGPGIPSGLDVFEPFRTTKRFGTGLGLPIARQIIEAHGGSLSHIEAPGGGTIFRVLLPRTAAQSEARCFEGSAQCP